MERTYNNVNGRAKCHISHVVLQRVQLRFVYVDVESGKNGVCYDYIGIYDGTNTSAPLLARVCGKKLPQDVFSSRNSLLVVFKTDYIYTWTGFKIKYKAKRTVSGTG